MLSSDLIFATLSSRTSDRDACAALSQKEREMVRQAKKPK